MQPVTLKKNREFRIVYAHGKSGATKCMAMVWLSRNYGGIRAGFSVSKKIGCSVRRNLVRRRLKEAFRELLPELQRRSVHIIFVARQPISQATYSEIMSQMESLLRRAELFGERK